MNEEKTVVGEAIIYEIDSVKQLVHQLTKRIDFLELVVGKLEEEFLQ